MKNVSGIYVITCTANGRRYVGSSKDIGQRFFEHKSDLRRGVHVNPHLLRAWNKYGEPAFEFRVLVQCDYADMPSLEKAVIGKLAPEFNCKGLDPERSLHSHSDETRAKLSASHMGNKYNVGSVQSAETRQKISKSWEHRRTVGVSAETRAKLSAANKGNKRGLGYKHSDETRAKMSASRMGWKYSEETKAKLSAAHKGKKFTDEHRAHLVEAWRRRREKL